LPEAPGDDNGKSMGGREREREREMFSIRNGDAESR
jgi:hypothetical protein